MNDKKTKEIINELCALDSSFVGREEELMKIISKLISSKPEIKVDEDFIKKVRKELLSEARNLSNKEKEFSAGKINFIEFVNKQYFIFGSTAVIIVIFFIIINFYLPININKTNLKQGNIAFVSGEIKKKGDYAFGSLAATDVSGRDAVEEKGIGFGGGGGTAPNVARSESGGGGWTGLPAPEYTFYKYVYSGKDIDLNQKEMAVYKKVTNADSLRAMNRLAGNVQIGILDLSKFSDTSLKNLHITEDKELGYDIYVDLEMGLVSINNNNRGWYNYNEKINICRNEECSDYQNLEITDVPSDQELIGMAEEFIKEKNINISQYSGPKVESYWKREYEMSVKKGYPYVPDVISVVYPLIIEGNEVKDMSGQNYGLRVNINIRKMRVEGLYGLGIYNYESSDYEIETSIENILKIAERGGYYGGYIPDNAKIKEIRIGEPLLKYVSYFQYNEGKSTELFIPALVFPILDMDENNYYREDIVVPLVKELIKERLFQGIPEPMPLIDSGVEISDEEGISENDE